MTETPATLPRPTETKQPPELLFDKRIADFQQSADDYAAMFTRLEHDETDPDKKVDYLEKRKQYSDVSQLIYGMTRGSNIWTLDALRPLLDQRKADLEQETIKFPQSREFARQLDTTDLTLAHIDGLNPTDKKTFSDLLGVRSERIFRSGNLFHSLCKKAENGELQSTEEATKEIDRTYRALCETEFSHHLETKYAILNEKLKKVQEMGCDAVREYVLDLVQHYDKDKDTELTVADLSSLRLVFFTDGFLGRLRGQKITRPVFLIEDDAQLHRITGKETVGFMSSHGFGHLLPESGLDDLPIIVSMNDKTVIEHEITHSMDVKCAQGVRKSYDGLLSEAIANFSSDDNSEENGNWSMEFYAKHYFEVYTLATKSDKDKMSFEDFSSLVTATESAISALRTKGFDKQTILKTMMVCSKVNDFINLVNGLANKEDRAI